MTPPFKKYNQPSGMVLILAILIIGAVLGSALIFSNLIIRGINQSRLIDQSIKAYYLAESGAERSLYKIRRREAIVDCTVLGGGAGCDSRGFCVEDNTVPCVNQNKNTLDITGDWGVEVSNEEKTTVNLGIGESFQLDLFSPDQGVTDATNVQSFRVESGDSPGSTLFGEITNLTWLVGGTLNCPNNFIPPNPAVSKGQITLDTSGDTGFMTGFVSEPEINPNCSYSLRIGNVILPSAQPGQFTISIYSEASGVDEEADRLDIPSRLIIDSEATWGNSLQQIRVRTPVRPPLSGLYDFVLFSEEEVIKQ